MGAEGGFIGGDLNTVSLWKPSMSAKLLETQAGGKPTVIFIAGKHCGWDLCCLTPEETRLLYAQTIASTLTSFFARAFSQRQYFDTIEQFFAAAEAGRLKAHQQDWLPPSLLHDALTVAPQVGEWSLGRKPGQRLLLCRTNAGTLLEGSFKIESGRVQSVTVRPRPER